MLMRAPQSVLLVVDIQERLAPAIHDSDAVIANTAWLLQVAAKVGVPVLATEQYPAGLGVTVPALRGLIPAEAIAEKTHFSAVAEGNLFDLPGGERRQYVVTGTETHVCVLQTVMDLLAGGRQVFVVAEAVGSRKPADKELALERMRAAGARIVSREMVAFEWLHRAGTDLFRAVSRDFIR
ncbi:hydrolase [Oryzomicrobium sp.]|uniref:hydrolase n=1 Tax=Oryzomicrobium sp. TaxID=1911578 RepID=UPI0025D0B57E|nr:hydrolase [Oryzomicrobium sp.]MCE1244377.1 hydrolase [Oryzomicrobium sp.]